MSYSCAVLSSSNLPDVPVARKVRKFFFGALNVLLIVDRLNYFKFGVQLLSGETLLHSKNSTGPRRDSNLGPCR